LKVVPSSGQSQVGIAAAPALDVTQAYNEHAAFIGRVIRRLLGEGPHIDDLIQETFIVAHRKAEQYDGRAAVRTWLYGIASRLCMHHRRGASRFSLFKGRLANQDPPPTPERPDQSLEQRQAVDLVNQVVAKMPFKQREVFVLYEIEELEGKDIAQMLDIPLGTVWTRLHKARQTFERLMRRRVNLGGTA
jgi:RNA polymerase sigma-70 factor (ECF subfamily)